MVSSILIDAQFSDVPIFRFLAVIAPILPGPIPTLASVVYYDSIFRRKKQENGGISRFLQKIKTIRIALKFPRDADLAS